LVFFARGYAGQKLTDQKSEGECAPIDRLARPRVGRRRYTIVNPSVAPEAGVPASHLDLPTGGRFWPISPPFDSPGSCAIAFEQPRAA
jgi:hypothetical protein